MAGAGWGRAVVQEAATEVADFGRANATPLSTAWALVTVGRPGNLWSRVLRSPRPYSIECGSVVRTS